MNMNNCLLKAIFRKILAAGIMTVMALPLYAALNHYDLVVPAYLMQGGQYQMSITAYNEDGTVYLPGHLITIILPNGSSQTVPLSGNDVFDLFVDATYLPDPSNTQTISVVKQGDSNIRDDENVIIEFPVRSFTFQIPGAAVQVTGVEFDLEITARDGVGRQVHGFNGNVDVSAQTGLGDIEVTAGGNGLQRIFGSTYSDGVAAVSLIIYGTDGAQNTISLKTVDTYIGVFGTGSISIDIIPNNFNHALILFPGTPGESHMPGTGLGKSGSPAAVQAGVAVNGVDVYLVDEWNNPILTTDPVFNPGPVDVDFTDNNFQPGDTLPAPVSFNGINHIQINGDQFIFTLAGVDHEIAVHDDRGMSDDPLVTENKSSVPVIHNDASQFEITLLASTQLAIDPLLPDDPLVQEISIKAIDAYGNVDPTYINQTAQISIEVAAGGTVEDTSVHINPVFNGAFPFLNVPNNIVNFTSGGQGVWSGQILVSKAETQINLYVYDISNSKIGRTNLFDNNKGAVSNLWFELPQERYTEGYYPGNDVLNPPRIFTAGEIMSDFTLYTVDKSWNNVQLGVPGTPLAIEIISPTGFIDVPAGQFVDSVGQGTISGVRLRTASPAMRLRGTIIDPPYVGVWGLSNPFVVQPAPYYQVVLAVPDQTLIPGGEYRDVDGDGIDELVGKSANLPLQQRVHQSFEITAYLVDEFFNPAVEPPTGWPVVELYVDGALIDSFIPTGSQIIRALTLTSLGGHPIMFKEQGTADPLKSEVVTVEAISGLVEYFTITGVQNKQAGDPFDITITAYDQHDNVAEDFIGQVTLTLISNGTSINYTGAIQPATGQFVFSATEGGILSMPVTVNYAGESMGAGSDNLQIKVSAFTPIEKFGLSGTFDIYENAYADILLVLPGDMYQPGGTTIKINSAFDVVAGNSFNVDLYAVDNFGNRTDQNGPITLSLTDTASYADFGGITNLAQGYVQQSVKIFTSNPQTINAAGPSGYTDSSDVTVIPGVYTSSGKILLLADNENHLPGSSIGKDGVPTPVIGYTGLILTVYACDEFYNIDMNYTDGNIRLTSDDSAIQSTGIQFTNGSVEVQGLFLRGGNSFPVVRVTATDEADPTKSSFSDIEVTPGAEFVVSVPNQVTVGTTFFMQVDLIDPNTGTPGVFNHAIFLEAVKADGTAATVGLGQGQLTLLNGTVVENQQHYDHVEVIQIKITDQFNRLAYSSNINVMPNNLKYIVDCPPSAAADELFTMTVTLYDTIFDNYPITTLDHQVSIAVDQGAGLVNVPQAILNNGILTIPDQNYTKSESIIFRTTGSINGYFAEGYDDMIITAGNYVKVHILAPGEIALPGIPSTEGKDSTGILPQAAKENFNATVYAVDRHWNVVSSVGAERQVSLSANDGSLTNYPLVSFNNGVAVMYNIQVLLPPSVEITANDTAGDVFSDVVNVPITGRTFTIECLPNYPPNNPTKFITGKDFDIIVTVMEYGSANAQEITDPTAFYLVPMDVHLNPLDTANMISLWPQQDPLFPNRFVTSPPATGGGTRFTIQYMVAEDVIFKAYDDDGWIGYSIDADGNTTVIPFEPEQVYYALSMPAEAIVGPPNTFTMTVSAKDANTDTVPINFTSDIVISVTNISNPTNLNDGNLLVTQRAITGGSVSFEQAFTRAGIITFKIEDVDDSGMSAEASILLHAGPLAEYEENIPDIIEAGTQKEIKFAFFDQYFNPIQNVLSVLSLDDDLSSYQLGKLNTLSIMSNSFGISTAQITVLEGYSGQLFFSAVFGNRIIEKIIKVVGPPVTNLTFGGLAHDTYKGHSVKPTDPIILAAEYDGEILSLDRIMYRIDDGEWQEYLGAFTITEVGVHTIEYYSVTIGETEHPEQIKKSFTVYVTQLTTAQEGLVNYPNPFQAGKESTALEFYHDQDSSMKLLIYDLMGQKVYEQDFVTGEVLRNSNGINKILWDGRNSDGRVVANGGYIVYLKINDAGRVIKRKIAVRK